MKNKLAQLAIECRENYYRFKSQESGVIAMEYAVMIVSVSLFVLAIFGDNGGFSTTLEYIWNKITTRIQSALQ
jgi:Flp pilus assembly pilin Flp